MHLQSSQDAILLKSWGGCRKCCGQTFHGRADTGTNKLFSLTLGNLIEVGILLCITKFYLKRFKLLEVTFNIRNAESQVSQFRMVSCQ